MIRDARMAGFIATSEPSTFNILSEIFDDPAQMKALFPRYNDGGLACLRRKALLEKLDDFNNMSLQQIRSAIAAICANNFGRVPPAKSDGVARRADGLLIPVDGKGKSFVFDVSGIHCTTKDVVGAQLQKHMALQAKTARVFAASYSVASNVEDFPAVNKESCQEEEGRLWFN